jgi:hypothetical protein
VTTPTTADDRAEITNLIAETHYCVDTFQIGDLVDLFVDTVDGLVPVAEFGFATWTGADELRQGFTASLARFEAAMHAISNLRLDLEGDRAVARYYVQGWHWLAESAPAGTPRPCDFLLLGVTTDDVVRGPRGWRVQRRRLELIGPSVAVGSLPPFLAGIGVQVSDPAAG